MQYDVWKSVKATNRDIRRSMRRHGTMIDGKRETGAKELAKDLAKTLSPIATEEGEEDEDQDQTRDRTQGHGSEEHEHERESEYQTDRRSFDSSVRSTIGTQTDHENDDDDDDVRSEKHIDASAYGSRHKALEVAIKSKTKKWLSYVKMDTVLTRRKSVVRKRDRVTSGASASSNGHGHGDKDFDQVSRRTSVSSFISTQTRLSTAAAVPPQKIPAQTHDHTSEYLQFPRPSQDGHTADVHLPASPSSHYDLQARRPSTASSFLTTASPPQRLPVRRMSLLKRTVSGRSISLGEQEEPNMETDNREGVYDTSKKQRVPSWVSTASHFTLTRLYPCLIIQSPS